MVGDFWNSLNARKKNLILNVSLPFSSLPHCNSLSTLIHLPPRSIVFSSLPFFLFYPNPYHLIILSFFSFLPLTIYCVLATFYAEEFSFGGTYTYYISTEKRKDSKYFATAGREKKKSLFFRSFFFRSLAERGNLLCIEMKFNFQVEASRNWRYSLRFGETSSLWCSKLLSRGSFLSTRLSGSTFDWSNKRLISYWDLEFRVSNMQFYKVLDAGA